MKNLEKLNIGMEFKNYKDICGFLEENVKGGKSKEIQLKDWNRFFEYEKQGYKFIITKINNSKKSIRLNKNEKQKLLEGVILHTILSQDLCGKTAIVNEKQLNTLSKFDLIDKDYLKIRNDKEVLKSLISPNQEMIFDIKSAEERSILEKFEVVMKRLNMKGVLRSNNKDSVFTTDGFVTNSEDELKLTSLYTVCRGRVMMKYNIKNLYHIYSGMTYISVNRFYEEVVRETNLLAEEYFKNGELSKRYNIIYVTRTYTIFFADINKCLDAYNDFTLQMNNIGLIDNYMEKFKTIQKYDRITCAKSRTKDAEGKEDGLKFRRGENYQKAVATYLDLLLG